MDRAGFDRGQGFDIGDPVDGADEDIDVDHLGEEAKDANYLVYSPGPKGGVRLITSSKIVEVGVRR